MFFKDQTDKQRKEYEKFLKIAGSLSNLFSDSKIPALYYRVAEKVFCRAFDAEDLSRSDIAVDAKKGNLGIGLKTFLAGNNKSLQKVAEFNNDRHSYELLDSKELVERVSQLRNARIEFTENAYDLDSFIYHCILREPGKFLIFEESMDKIDIENIKDVKKGKSSITFNDKKNEYSFMLSKSTLTKRFRTEPIEFSFGVDILKDPLDDLDGLLRGLDLLSEEDLKIKGTVFLPLYSVKYGSVQEKSGLNQWNAGGRDRNVSEVYIPVPAEVHKNFPGFFPDRDTPFTLKLPNGEEVESRICQAEGKALMSCPNKKLGHWILRDVLKLEEGELFTDEKMQSIGIDSVRIDKINDLEFEMNFSETGSYEEFKSNYIKD